MVMPFTISHQPIDSPTGSAELMRSESTKAFATRLPRGEAEQIEETIEKRRLTKSALVRRALRFYITENPDRIPALASEDFTNQMIAAFEK